MEKTMTNPYGGFYVWGVGRICRTPTFWPKSYEVVPLIFNWVIVRKARRAA
jgi:hypothetical protein